MLAVLLAAACTGPVGAAQAPVPASPPASASPAPAGRDAAAGSAGPVAAAVGVRFPDSGDAAPVVPVGVAPDGQMEVPPEVDTVGWYRFGPRPGDPAGAAVLAGHVDDAVQGPGAFHRLADLGIGDRVEVDGADGVVRAFRVVETRALDKSALPVTELFARDGPPRLHLVTCGGPFDADAGGYRDNVVVAAEPW
ncbi:class F sortase [Pseudonocardia alni]|uniref:class F sortase n=1 Tax=Pseudonocardia alni TaxID=33907 RepID=UPI0027A21E4C|nr:class F sortase [Pseudonocardia alni]